MRSVDGFDFHLFLELNGIEKQSVLVHGINECWASDEKYRSSVRGQASRRSNRRPRLRQRLRYAANFVRTRENSYCDHRDEAIDVAFVVIHVG